MSDLTLPGARAERDSLATRTDVLDKVGALATLPDDMHVTTDMVANFYAVDREAVASLVKRNRDEFEHDGYVVIVRSTFEERFGVNLSTNSARIALFSRRAVLRAGMLLRDSKPARDVRSYLLDSEVAPREMSEDEIVQQALDIMGRRVNALAAKVAQLEPKAEFYDELMDADGTYPFAAVARILGWGRNVMMRDLRRLGVLQPNNLPYRRYDHHFKVTPGTYTNRKTGETVPTATTSVRPSGLEFLRKKLAAVSVQIELEGANA